MRSLKFVRYLVVASLAKNKWDGVLLTIAGLFMLSFDKRNVAVCER
ncbi:hypothetical protein THF5H11_40058 [Vibrio jasicida]|nr:hypothetical protein THF5H11_40058 [Vibrio jasicida]CAH1608212.1 hypothetical protein THF5G08_50425 [Vibrio jasicida]